ncbi:hypothetical protein GCM10009642_41620 [Nocardiopsis metallicus]
MAQEEAEARAQGQTEQGRLPNRGAARACRVRGHRGPEEEPGEHPLLEGESSGAAETVEQHARVEVAWGRQALVHADHLPLRPPPKDHRDRPR